MSAQIEPTQWNGVSKSLHWLIAGLILFQIPLGLYGHEQREIMLETLDLAQLARVTEIISLHKSIGLVIGMLMILRLVWRMFHKPPPPVEGLSPLIRLAGHVAHWALYALVFSAVISGFVINEASSHKIEFFGLFTIPNVLSFGEGVRELAERVHWLSMLVLIAAILLHVGAALYHHFGLKDDTLRRMLPFGGGRNAKMEDS